MAQPNFRRELVKGFAWLLALAYGVYDIFFSGSEHSRIMIIPGIMMLVGLIGTVIEMRKLLRARP